MSLLTLLKPSAGGGTTTYGDPTIERHWGPFKAPCGVRINWGHPLSRGLVGCYLFNEGAGLPHNTVKVAPVTSRHADSVWTGGGLSCPTYWTLGALNFGTAHANLTARTLMFIGNIGTGSYNPGVFYWSDTNRLYFTTTLMHYERACGGATKKWCIKNVDPAIFATGNHTIAVSDDGTINYTGTSVYVDGTLLTNNYSQDSTDASWESETGVNLVTFYYGAGWINQALIWNRALSQDEIRQVTLFPYCFIQPAYMRIGTVVAGGEPETITIDKWHYYPAFLPRTKTEIVSY